MGPVSLLVPFSFSRVPPFLVVIVVVVVVPVVAGSVVEPVASVVAVVVVVFAAVVPAVSVFLQDGALLPPCQSSLCS